MKSLNRTPWIIAACSLTFAVGVLLATMLKQDRGPQAVEAIRVSAAEVSTPALPAVPPEQTPLARNPADRTSTPTASPRATSRAPEGTPAPERPGHHVSGLVTDLRGNPIPHAQVVVFLEERGSQTKVEGKADAGGKFLLRNLPVARVQSIVAEASGFARSEPMPPFELPVDGLEISLRSLAGAELRVLDARGDGEPKPFEGRASLFLMKQSSQDGSTATLGIDEPAVAPGQFVAIASDEVTIQGGRHSLKALDPGTYKAAILLGDQEYAESEPFKVDTAEGGQGTLTLGQRQELAGVVKSDPEQAPIEGVAVLLEPVSRPTVAGAHQGISSRTSSNGEFTLTGVTPGDYRLTLAAEGYTTKVLDRVAVPAGTRPAPATFYLVRVQPAIDVTVYGPQGRAFAGAPLVLISSGTGAKARSFFGRTDSSGLYRFDALLPGRYTLAVTSPEDRRRQKVLDVIVREKETTGSVVVRFSPTVRLSGRAKRANKPIAEGLLSFLPRGAVAPEVFAKTDAEGNYSVDLEPGEYMAGEARQEKRVPIRIEPGEIQSTDVDLP